MLLNIEKQLIFNIEKVAKTDKCRSSPLDDNLLLNKKRSPWTKEVYIYLNINFQEDEAIIDLVLRYGTKNWTLLVNKMGELYTFFHRSGKQCRER